jgi:hypothetical protein
MTPWTSNVTLTPSRLGSPNNSDSQGMMIAVGDWRGDRLLMVLYPGNNEDVVFRGTGDKWGKWGRT